MIYGTPLEAVFAHDDTLYSEGLCIRNSKHTQKLQLVPLDDILVESLEDPVDYFSSVERKRDDFDFAEERIAKAFSELPLMRREVLRLLFVEEKTPEEVAEHLGISLDYVYKQNSRVLIKLRNALTEGESK